MQEYLLTKEEVIKKLASDKHGLSTYEAEDRLKKYGKNEIKEIYHVNALKIFLKQFNSWLIYILLFAIIISLSIKHFIDASVIGVIVLLNAVIGFIQQYRAEKSISELKKMYIPQTKVFRDGKLVLLSSELLVPGDVVLFEEGDKITADCRIIESQNLEVNESILTGESNPVEKKDTILSSETMIHDRKNILFTGTTLIHGNTQAMVIQTGQNSEFGRIAQKLQEIKVEETPLQKKVGKFAKQITIIVLILAAITFIVGSIEGKDKIEMLLMSIALIVSAIPEGLPAVITISLALATKKMLTNNILVRRLPAAETLGSVTVICSDKTGTMTKEKMTVVEIFCGDKIFKLKDGDLYYENKKIMPDEKIYNLVRTSILSSNARFEETADGYQIFGDPTEQAFISLSLNLGMNKKIMTEHEPRVKEISFSSERKMMSILRKADRRNILYSKGSPSSILDKCSFEWKDAGVVELTAKKRAFIKSEAEKLEKKGLRVLSFSYRFVSSEKNLEEGLIFIGLMAILDPPRPEIKQSIAICKQAGIKVKMITGDSLLTAKTVASEIGIEGDAIGGWELEKLSDNELIDRIDNIAIFARISPHQKLRIVEILKFKGEQVAITGDGVNDILALKRADIGVAMGKRGSDIARDVSDLILIDDNFYSIVKGVEEGRLVYENSKKATKFLMASNLGEILLLIISVILNLPLPLLPLQVLWINLVTDSIPALALTKEKEENIMQEKPKKESSIFDGILLPSLFASILAVISSFIIFKYGLTNYSLDEARTFVMLTLIGFETLFVFTCRSEKSLFKVGFFSNPSIIIAVILVFIVQALLLLTPLAGFFSLTSVNLIDFAYIFLLSLPGIVFFEAWKLIKR